MEMAKYLDAKKDLIKKTDSIKVKIDPMQKWSGAKVSTSYSGYSLGDNVSTPFTEDSLCC